MRFSFPLRYINVLRWGFSQRIHPFLFHFLSPGIKWGHLSQRQMLARWCVSPKKAIPLGITNSEFSFGDFSHCALWTQKLSGWHVCINQLCPKRTFLLLISSVYSISLYQSLSFSQDHRGSGNQMWTRQNTRLLQTKPQGGNECMRLRVCECVC